MLLRAFLEGCAAKLLWSFTIEELRASETAPLFQMVFLAVGCLLPDSRRARDRRRPWLPTFIVAAGLGGVLCALWSDVAWVRALPGAPAAALAAVLGLASGRMVRATLIRGPTPAGRLRLWCAQIGGAATVMPILEVVGRALGVMGFRCAIGAGIATLLLLTVLDHTKRTGEPAAPSGSEEPALPLPLTAALLLGAALAFLAGSAGYLAWERVRHLHTDRLFYTCRSGLALGALAVLLAASRPARALRLLPWICLAGAGWIGLIALWTARAPEPDLTQTLRELLRLRVLEGYSHDITISAALLGVPSFALGCAVSLLPQAGGDPARRVGALLLALLGTSVVFLEPLRVASAGSGVWLLVTTGALLAATGACTFRRARAKGIQNEPAISPWIDKGSR